MELVLLPQVDDEGPSGQFDTHLVRSQADQTSQRIRHQVGSGSLETAVFGRHASNVPKGSGEPLVSGWDVSQ